MDRPGPKGGQDKGPMGGEALLMGLGGCFMSNLLAAVGRADGNDAAFHRAALQAGAKDNGAPGLRPKYSGQYYAAFVIGPDGHNIEMVCHAPEG